jgi:hypothetical protein
MLFDSGGQYCLRLLHVLENGDCNMERKSTKILPRPVRVPNMYARYSSGQRNALRQIALQTNATFDRTIT